MKLIIDLDVSEAFQDKLKGELPEFMIASINQAIYPYFRGHIKINGISKKEEIENGD